MRIVFAAMCCAVMTAGTASVGDATLLAGSEWGFDDGSRRIVRFASGGKIAGNAGCNRFSGQYEAKQGRIRISPLAATRKACAGPVMQRESEFFGMLEKARMFDATHLKFVLKNDQGEVLASLTRRDWD